MGTNKKLRGKTIDVDLYKPPIVWFGSKWMATAKIWAALGDVTHYVEPFCGSAVTALQKPDSVKRCVLNDLDAMLVNCLRAVARDAAGVLGVLEPLGHRCESDMHACNARLLTHRQGLRARVEADPEYYDTKLAGWYLYVNNLWLGAGNGDCAGPWIVVKDAEGVDTLVRREKDGNERGLRRKVPNTGERGLSRQVPNTVEQGLRRKVPNTGEQGLWRQKPNTGERQTSYERAEYWLRTWQEHLHACDILTGPWHRATSNSIIRAESKTDVVGIYLDPPYEAHNGAVYGDDSNSLALTQEILTWVRATVVEHPTWRIVLSENDGVYDELLDEGWTKEIWTRGAGYGDESETEGDKAKRQEALYKSPTCQSNEPNTSGAL